MELQIQDLVSSIRKDGIEAANAEAEAIISEAKKKAETIVILTHEAPDGDAIGSSLGIGLALEKMGKNVDIIIPEYSKSFVFLPGIEKLKKSDFKTLKEMFEYVTNKDKNFGVIEEQIIQHETLNKLYPLAINSLRIVSIVVDGTPHIVYVVSKMGNEGKFVDNMENSGLCCPVDTETGKISNVAHTSKLITYDTHPYTNIKLIGYELPYIKEAMELVKKAALEVPQIKYVGWDVFIGPNGPGIIEGNDYPGYDFWQLPEHTPDKIGLVPYYNSLIKDLKL